MKKKMLNVFALSFSALLLASYPVKASETTSSTTSFDEVLSPNLEVEEINQQMRVVDTDYSVYKELDFNEENILPTKLELDAIFDVDQKYINLAENKVYYHIKDLGWLVEDALKEELVIDSISEEEEEITSEEENFAQIIHEEVKDELLKVTDTGYSVYSEPYNTKGAEYKGTVANKFKLNDTARIIKYVETSDDVKVYLVEGLGWVNTNAFTEFATITYEEELSKYMNIKDGGYSVFSQPSNTANAKREGTLRELHPNTTAKITKYAETSEGVKVYLVENIGWVSTNAFTEFATITHEEVISKKMRIVDGGYSVFSEPSNTPFSIRKGSLKELKGSNGTVELTKYVETSEGATVYLVKDVGYVHINAFDDFAEIATKTNMNQTLKVTDGGYSVYSQPYNTVDYMYKGSLGQFKPVTSAAKITSYVKTSEGVEVYFVEGVGWVDTRAFGEFVTISKQNAMNKQMSVLDPGYSVYTEPYNVENFKRKGSLGQFKAKNSQVKVTSYAETSEGVKVYFVEGIGWVDTRALTDRTVITKEIIKLERAKVIDAGYSVYSKPYGTEGAKYLGTLNQFHKKNKMVNLTRYVETSQGVKTYYVSGAGWVDYRAVRVQPGVAEYLGTSKDKLLRELTSQEHTNYYLGTPYKSLSSSPYNSNGIMSPNGDIKPGFGPGMNCTGFVAYPLKKVGGDMNRITNVANAWGGIGNGYNWRDALMQNTSYYEFGSISALLNSGQVSKGDIIYFEPVYTDPYFDCHLGYFWGNNPRENRIWHSTGPGNNISHIYSGTRFSKIMLFKM